MNNQNTPNLKSFSSLFQKIKTWNRNYKQKYPNLSTVTKVGSFLFFGAIFSLITFILLIRFGAFGKLPSTAELKDIRNSTASEIYSTDEVLLGKYYIQNRINVTFDDISPDIINALVSTEDARFFEHKGIDVRSWFRVFFKSILLNNNSSGGGSTLSQQLAKNLYHRKNHRFLSLPINKIKEMFVARRLETSYTKDQLLNLYLNTVPFGGNRYGVKVASKQFFNTSPKDIKVEQAAILVGMLKANTAYDPVRHPKRALKRRNTVLNQMKKYGHLTQVEYDSLHLLPLNISYTKENHNEGLATYFREHLRIDLDQEIKKYKKPDGTPYNLYTDGLKIYTTIDSKLQSYAEAAVNEHLKSLQHSFDQHWKGKKPWGNDAVIAKEMKKSMRYISLKKMGWTEKKINANFNEKISMIIYSGDGEVEKKMSPLDSIKYYYCLLNAGFMAMEPQTGFIKAWVGGIDHKYFQYDHVKSKRQVGSTFKPIVYAAALVNNIRPCDYIYNRLVTYSEYEDWQPKNSDGKYEGLYSMTGALTKSVNSIAVNLISKIGIDSVIILAEKMGITSEIPEVPSIALGTVEASLFEMVTVYSTFANRGKKVNPSYLLRIETADGKILVNYKTPSDQELKEALDEDYADMMIHMMQSVVDSGTARRLRFRYNLTNEIAGKTGTTQSHADGWFMGITPNLVGGSWVGGESPKVRFRNIKLGQGANTALPIWALFMQKTVKDKEYKNIKNASFPIPPIHVIYELECDPYLEESVYDEMMGNEVDTVDTDTPFDEALDKILDSFGKRKRKKRINEKPNLEEKKKKEFDKIRKKREKAKQKAERKRKRKEKWDKLLKGKNG